MSASKWKPYPESKPSEIEGIGDIPFHWKVVRAKQLEKNSSELVQTGPFGAQLHASDYIEDEVKGVPLILIKNVNQLKIHSNDIPRISPEKANQLSLYRLKSGDIVFSRVGSVGRIARVSENEEGWLISGQMLRLRFTTELLDSDYSLFLISSKSIQTYFELQSVGTTRDSINSTILSEMPLTIPPIGEQRVIASFCRTFAEQIANAICNLENLMKKLEEKRSALITQAVTKGLNSDVKMKDSGNKWIGKIPAHWNISRLKYHANIKGRIGFRGYTVSDLVEPDEGALTLGATHISSSGEIDLSSPVYISWEKYFESPEIMVSEGDILIVQRGSCGKIGYVSNDLGPATINPSLAILKNTTFDSGFMNYLLNSDGIEKLLDSIQGTTAVPMISQEQIGEIPICIPPSDEIESILDFLNSKTLQFKETESMLKQEINQLKEFRSALISAAVTGKIDVRSL